MLEQNNRWEEKIKFFSKFLGFEQLELQETLDQTNKTQFVRRPSKGIKLVQESYLNFSSIVKKSDAHRLQRKWLDLLRHPFQRSSRIELLKLTGKSTYLPKKILPWLIKNSQKINIKLFNLKVAQLRAILSPLNPYRLEKKSMNIQTLTNKINYTAVLEVVCALVLIRQDFVINDTFLLITETVFHYLCDSPIQAFTMLSYICCSESYLPLISNNQQCQMQIVSKISFNIKKNCMSATFLTRDRVHIENYVYQWMHSFWSCIADIGSPLHQKILYYIMAHQMSVQCLSKICEATVEGLARILNQGSVDKSAYTLSNPKIFLDEDVFIRYLFIME